MALKRTEHTTTSTDVVARIWKYARERQTDRQRLVKFYNDIHTYLLSYFTYLEDS